MHDKEPKFDIEGEKLKQVQIFKEGMLEGMAADNTPEMTQKLDKMSY